MKAELSSEWVAGGKSEKFQCLDLQQPSDGDSYMDIKRIGSQASDKGPSEWFTGTVRIDPLFQAPARHMFDVLALHSSPGARTAWHTHPLGQTAHRHGWLWLGSA